MSVDVSTDAEPRARSVTARWPLGYGLVVLTSLLLGTVGIVPFVILGYAIIQWVLAPLGLAVADSSSNDGSFGLIVAGVLLPLGIVSAWAGVVRWLTRRFVLIAGVVWPLAVVALVLPVVLFAITKTY